MAEEKQEAMEHASVLVEHILGNEAKLTTLVTGADKDRTAIAVSAVTSTGDDAAVQEAFLRSLIRIMGIEGESNETDRRDAAVELMKCAPVMNIFPRYAEALFDTYCEAVNSQTKENDPHAGSINSLLDAGIVLAPYFPINDLARTQLSNLWNQRAKEFAPTEGRDYIDEHARHIAERMTKLGSRDARVHDLRKQRLKNKEIADLLGVKEHSVEQSVGRLIDSGDLASRLSPRDIAHIEFLKKAKAEQKARVLAALVDNVHTGRQKGLTQKEMVASFSVTLARIKYALGILKQRQNMLQDTESAEILEGKEELPQRSRRRSKEEILEFDARVNNRINSGLTESGQVAKALEEKKSTVSKSLKRLRAQQRIEQAPKTRSTEEITKFLDSVLSLLKEGKKVNDIKRALVVEEWMVHDAIKRLREQGSLRQPQRSKKTKAFDKQVLALKKQGLQEDEIARLLHVEERPWIVKKSLRRLRAKELIPRKFPGSRQSIMSKEIYDTVRNFKKKGYTNKIIAKEVGRSDGYVEYIITQLRKQGRLE